MAQNKKIIDIQYDTVKLLDRDGDNNLDSITRKSPYNYHFKLWKDFGLKDLSKSEDSLIIRITDCNSVIEVNSEEGIFLYLAVWGKNGIISKKYKIEKCSKTFIDSLNALDIENLQADAYLDKYKFGDDGCKYGFEFSTPLKYRYYSYWSPSVQEESNVSARHADLIIKFADRYVDAQKYFNEFTSELKPGKYGYCMISMIKKRATFFRYIKIKLKK